MTISITDIPHYMWDVTLEKAAVEVCGFVRAFRYHKKHGARYVAFPILGGGRVEFSREEDVIAYFKKPYLDTLDALIEYIKTRQGEE